MDLYCRESGAIDPLAPFYCQMAIDRPLHDLPILGTWALSFCEGIREAIVEVVIVVLSLHQIQTVISSLGDW